ncbi:MAG: helix-turn-helix transcriptional regulator [Fodinibius sp.]|nr:helix-turn-helix transcriptional regulator [Fodinibius sp.]
MGNTEQSKAGSYPSELTDRELEVLVLICKEMTNREIAEKLDISVRTVDAHRHNLLQKTRAQNTAG